MPASFLGLPAELRNEIYKQILVCREPINPWSEGYDLVPNLLLTNSKILHEASSLLYGNNCFDLTTWHPNFISKFLDTIGLINASRLEHIRIDFPGFLDVKVEARLEEGCLHALNDIQARCTSLKSITMTPPPIYFTDIQLDSVDSRDRALGLIVSHFRAIASLQEIVLEVYEDDPDPDFGEQIQQKYGWTLKVIEREEEEEWDDDRRWDIIDENEFLRNNDNDDDYDIDNDSDIWRRTAD